MIEIVKGPSCRAYYEDGVDSQHVLVECLIPQSLRLTYLEAHFLAPEIVKGAPINNVLTFIKNIKLIEYAEFRLQ